MEHKKLTKIKIIIYASLGVVFSIYVLVNIFNGFKDFDNVIFPIYFATVLSASYFDKGFLQNNFVKYPFTVMLILFLYFLIKTYIV